MRMIDPLLMEFDRESATTRKLLERVPSASFEWAPHKTSMTLGKLATHVATLPALVASFLHSEGFDFGAGGGAVPPTPSTSEELVASFDKAVKDAKGAMSGLDDEKAVGPWNLTSGGKVLMSMPRIALVRSFLINHSIHHRGQLSVYLRMLDVPIPSVYGPSGDENPFA